MLNLIKSIKSFFYSYKNGYSYSQFSEDKIISTICWAKKINIENYIDIGANHPVILNNSFYFYKMGIRGINIEPDKSMFKLLSNTRKSDINLNCAIGDQYQEKPFFRFENSMYNTSSLEERIELEKKNIKVIETDIVTFNTYNNIVETYLNRSAPTILFIDAEGYDSIIIKSIDYNLYPPKIICVETFVYGNGEKDFKLIDEIKGMGYSIISDTFVNTIFLRNDLV